MQSPATVIERVSALDEACRKQQLGESWFPTFADVPPQAISMTIKQIMKTKKKILRIAPMRGRQTQSKYASTEKSAQRRVPRSCSTTRTQRSIWVCYRQLCCSWVDKAASLAESNKKEIIIIKGNKTSNIAKKTCYLDFTR
jgi:hypothetical protein